MDIENMKYKKNFIDQVILRIDFYELCREEDIFNKNVINEILANYPRIEKEQYIKFNYVNINDSSPAWLNGLLKTYATLDGNNRVNITNKYISIDIKDYKTFEQLFDSFQNIIQVLYQIKPAIVNRTGIRYINYYDPNKIRINKNYFVPIIANTLNTGNIQDNQLNNLIRSTNIAEYRLEDMNLNFRYGIYNRNYPNLIKEADFALDYDCFTIEALHSSDDILRYLKKGHDYIQDLFEHSITDSLRRVMNNG